MKKTLYLILLSVLAADAAMAQFVINNSSGLFDPSFRGQGNTTWFGWGPGSFDGASNNELIDNPSPTIGSAPVGLSFTQTPAHDILSSSDNIYTGFAPGNSDLLFTVPTSGTVGSGFTTIIIQGRTLFGPFGATPAFSLIDGTGATLAVDVNSTGSGQFWAKYEIPGNQSVYDLTVTLSNEAISMGELEFDTHWSPTGFAPDFVAVPEPSTMALLGMGVAAAIALRKRARQNR